MGEFSNGLGRYLNRDDLSLKAAGLEAASTTGVAIEIGDKAIMNLDVVVSAVAGAGTVLVTVEGSHDGLTWYTLGRIGKDEYLPGFENAATAPAVIDAIGTYRATLPAARYVRYKSTIAGTSVTYSIGGTAV